MRLRIPEGGEIRVRVCAFEVRDHEIHHVFDSFDKHIDMFSFECSLCDLCKLTGSHTNVWSGLHKT